MRSIEYIMYSYVLSIVISMILTLVFESSTTILIISTIVNFLQFIIILTLQFLLNELTVKNESLNYLIAFFIAYALGIVFFWNINNPNYFFNFLIAFHSGKKFLIYFLPFIFTNLLTIIILRFKK